MTRAMKDSGIEWIGEIPKDWDYVPLKAYYEFEKGKNAALYTQEYIGENEGPYPVYSGQTQDEGIMGRVNSYDYDIKKCLFTTTVGAKVMTPKMLTGRFCLSQNCLIMKQIQQVYDNFIYYLLIPLFDYYKSLIPTYMQPSLRIEDLKSYRFYLPSMPEQQKIADFLDEKCSHIDSVLEKVRASIDEYKQLKQSVITQAVTKGIKPNRPMKDSGIEWMGEIPQDWSIIAHKYVMYKDKKICEHYNGEDIISLTMSGVIKRDLDAGGKMPTTFDGYQYVEPEDLLLCLFDIDVTPRCVGVVKDYGITSPAYSRFKVNKGYFNKYYDYLLRMIDNDKVFVHLAKNLRSSLKEDDFGAIKTIVPPMLEQKQISDYLDDKCSEIDKLITKKEQLIAELETYKKSLIYEYVTGKKEVI